MELKAWHYLLFMMPIYWASISYIRLIWSIVEFNEDVYEEEEEYVPIMWIVMEICMIVGALCMTIGIYELKPKFIWPMLVILVLVDIAFIVLTVTDEDGELFVCGYFVLYDLVHVALIILIIIYIKHIKAANYDSARDSDFVRRSN